MRHVLSTTDVDNLVKGTFFGDPFSVLGMHPSRTFDGQDMIFVRTLQPQATEVEIFDETAGCSRGRLRRVHSDGLFQADFEGSAFFAYHFIIHLPDGHSYATKDVYSFAPFLGETDLYLFGEGQHWRLYEKMGAHLMEQNAVAGVGFSVWAPNAKRVSVVGPFNGWDGRRHMMRPRGVSGVWELFVPDMKQWDLYKFELVGPDGRLLPLKTDPYGFAFELRPKTAALVFDGGAYQWHDDDFVQNKRRLLNALDAPISIYEMHAGSWRRHADGTWLSYRELAEQLPAYLVENGWTHVEFLPLAEYPFDGSWGYQQTGLYAPTSRYGTPDDFKALIDALHQAGIAVIMDWVPAHFPKDAFGLCEFDGTALYEHADPRQGEHKDWGTKIYNYDRNEVANFLLANALFWIREYHIDGLRVDAVASMLYLDYSRREGEWIPNQFGGRENLAAIAFLRKLNELVFAHGNGATTFAEESTSWPMVSRPTYAGGLGFGYKWNMGWMHDTLHYLSQDPYFRKYHHNELTFSMLYAFSENFTLPLSHDEVVHGKHSLLEKMPGDRWQKLANLRLYYAYLFAHPGKKLLFMGAETAGSLEWNYATQVEWNALANKENKGVFDLLAALNRFYRAHPALWKDDFTPAGFEWIDGNDFERSCFSFMRKGGGETLVFVCNFTPEVRRDYPVGVNEAGVWEEIFTTDAERFGGSGVVNAGPLTAVEPGWNFKKYAVRLTLPPLGVVCLKRKDGQEK